MTLLHSGFESDDEIISVIQSGGLIVYPTEAVYGIGCDYKQQESVNKLLSLKKRPVEKGLILVGSHVQQILPLIQPDDGNQLAKALKTWPGHFTWVFKASKSTPKWISGEHDSVAVRISKHPVIKRLCSQLNQPIVSTSANISGSAVINDMAQIKKIFSDRVDCYIDEPLGNHKGASQIRNAATGLIIR